MLVQGKEKDPSALQCKTDRSINTFNQSIPQSNQDEKLTTEDEMRLIANCQKRIYRILHRLANKRGIAVILNVPLPERTNGLWCVDQYNQIEYIGLNPNLQDPAKRNFVFAHELGHSILHKGKLNNALYQENGWCNEYAKKIEAEANGFAENIIARLQRWYLVMGDF